MTTTTATTDHYEDEAATFHEYPDRFTYQAVVNGLGIAPPAPPPRRHNETAAGR